MSGYYSPQTKSSLKITSNGITLTDDASELDFTGAGQTGSVIGNIVTVDIPGGGSGSTLTMEIPSGAIDGSNVTYTIVHTPIVFLTYGSILADPEDYSISGTTITMTFPLSPGNVLQSFYNA